MVLPVAKCQSQISAAAENTKIALGTDTYTSVLQMIHPILEFYLWVSVLPAAELLVQAKDCAPAG